MIEQHVFGPDVGQRLWLALKAGSDAPTLGIALDETLPDLYKSQGMKTSVGNYGCFCYVRKMAPR